MKGRESVDIDFTLRRVFGKQSFRFELCHRLNILKLINQDPYSGKPFLLPLKVTMSFFKQPRPLERAYASNCQQSSAMAVCCQKSLPECTRILRSVSYRCRFTPPGTDGKLKNLRALDFLSV